MRGMGTLFYSHALIISSLFHDSGIAIIPTLKERWGIPALLNALEEQRAQLEDTIRRIGFEIDEKKQKIYNAEVMHKSLTKFSQVYEKATPMEIKDLLPYFVESITFAPEEIQIALFDQPTEKGLFVNHSSQSSLELSEWLPREGSNLGPSG